MNPRDIDLVRLKGLSFVPRVARLAAPFAFGLAWILGRFLVLRRGLLGIDDVAGRRLRRVARMFLCLGELCLKTLQAFLKLRDTPAVHIEADHGAILADLA